MMKVNEQQRLIQKLEDDILKVSTNGIRNLRDCLFTRCILCMCQQVLVCFFLLFFCRLNIQIDIGINRWFSNINLNTFLMISLANIFLKVLIGNCCQSLPLLCFNNSYFVCRDMVLKIERALRLMIGIFQILGQQTHLGQFFLFLPFLAISNLWSFNNMRSITSPVILFRICTLILFCILLSLHAISRLYHIFILSFPALISQFFH